MRSNILLMTADRTVTAAVARALSSNGHVVSAVAQDQQQLLKQLVANPSVIALVDLDPTPTATLAQLEQLAGRFPGARFVALAGAVQPELLQDAMEAGVRRVVSKQTMEAELQGVLNRLSPGDALGADAGRGEVITILQAAGGCGATTIAANLAAEIAAAQAPQASQGTVVMDLDCCY